MIDLTGGAYCPEGNRKNLELVKPDWIKPPNPYLRGVLKAFYMRMQNFAWAHRL
jgi:hypothetical protein